MIERTELVRTADGDMPTFIVHPDEDGPFPVVLIYMDALGIREELRDFAHRIAAAGYYAMLPNLFHRNGGPSFDAAPLAHGILDPEMMALNAALSMEMTVADTRELVAFAQQDGAARMPIAAIGYCMGARHALAAAAAFPTLVRAVASLHGGRLVLDGPASPHHRIASIEAEAYFAWAVDDPVAPLSDAEIVATALRERGLPHRVEVHAGALHGFTFPERYCHHKQAADRVWSRLFALFRRTLHSTPQDKKDQP